jgi:hypothetical protein
VRLVVAAALAVGLPLHSNPCKHARQWPHEVRSKSLPIAVHYPRGVSAASAEGVLATLERDWGVETTSLGFRAPLTGGRCGGDDDVDVFVWPGSDDYVDEVDDAGHAYMVIDPAGEGGGDELPTTLAHELNHMCQAADSWDQPAGLYEATSTFVESQVEPALGARAASVADFQAAPEWAPDHDDGYDSWFMYGAELYLEVLRDGFFDGRETAIADLWRGMHDGNWADAVRSAVAPATLDDTIARMAVWRWYVGPRDDGHHLANAAELDPPAYAGEAAPGTRHLTLGEVDALGTSYVAIDRGMAEVRVRGLRRGETVRMFALPGTAGADADELVVTRATATVDATDAARTLAIVVVPAAYDPDDPPAAADLRLAFTWSAH